LSAATSARRRPRRRGDRRLFSADATVVDEAKRVAGSRRSALGRSAGVKYRYTTRILDTVALAADRYVVTGL
jgi:hypothetical protein